MRVMRGYARLCAVMRGYARLCAVYARLCAAMGWLSCGGWGARDASMQACWERLVSAGAHQMPQKGPREAHSRDQEAPRSFPEAPKTNQKYPKGHQLRPTWHQLIPTGAQLLPTWPKLAPTWLHFEAKMKCPRSLSHWFLWDETHFDHFCLEVLLQPVFSSPQTSGDAILATCWSQADPTWPQNCTTWPRLRPTWPQLGPTLAPTWPQLGPNLAQLSPT